MKFCLLKSEDTVTDSTEAEEKVAATTIQTDVVKGVISEPNENKATGSAILNAPDSKDSQPNLGQKVNPFVSETSNIKFKTFFEAAPNSSKIFSGLPSNSDVEMDWETNMQESPGKSNVQVDDFISRPSTSVNLDDSVIILETKNIPNKSAEKFEGSPVIDVDEVLVISDAEDEWSNNVKKNPSRVMDVICVSSPDILHVSPPNLSVQPRKRYKKETLNTMHNDPWVIPVKTIKSNLNRSTKKCPVHSQSEPNVVLEIKNCSPVKRTFSRIGSKTKSSRKPAQKQTGRPRDSSCVSVKTSLLRKKRLQRQRRNLIDSTSITGGCVSRVIEPDVYVTAEKLVNVQSRKRIKPSSSSVQTSCVNIQNKENATSVMNDFSISRKNHPCKRSLRPIVIDGSNIAFSHGQKWRPKRFSCKGIELCVKYFQDRGHNVTVFVPQHRRCKNKEVDGQEILERLGRQQVVVFTPSRTVDGVLISSYDDRFILDLAARTGAVIVSNDNYRDIKNEKPEWKEAVNNRLLMYVFVGDLFMVPDDPLGSKGVSLDVFLSFSA